MRYNLIHNDHDTLVVTPQYAKLYAEAIKKHYPNHKVEESDFVEQGQAYLFNGEKLKAMYQAKIDANKN
jgi:hypothetical protein